MEEFMQDHHNHLGKAWSPATDKQGYLPCQSELTTAPVKNKQ